jgi:hypothetical protein
MQLYRYNAILGHRGALLPRPSRSSWKPTPSRLTPPQNTPATMSRPSYGCFRLWAAVMRPPALSACIGVHDAWRTFGAHWNDLEVDPYAQECGTRRLRRYGHFVFRDGVATSMAHDAFLQPQDSNPLYLGRERHFQPLTEAFATDPLLHAVMAMLAHVAIMMVDGPAFSVKVTPFRVVATDDTPGEPAPEGIHRDGVTLVTSLLIGRCNAEGGESSVFDLDGNRLLATTLSQPGTMLLGDDRRTLHGVSPVPPADPERPAMRDVLVITFAPPSGR